MRSSQPRLAAAACSLRFRLFYALSPGWLSLVVLMLWVLTQDVVRESSQCAVLVVFERAAFEVHHHSCSESASIFGHLVGCMEYLLHLFQ